MEKDLNKYWDRVFTTVSGEGNHNSYFLNCIALAAFSWVSILEKKKKRQKKNI
jgi:hypothetical protein